MRYLTEEETKISSRSLYSDTAIGIFQEKESRALEHAINRGIGE